MQTWTEVQKKKVKKKPTLIFSELPGSTDGWMDGCLAEPVDAQPPSAGFSRAGRVMAMHARLVMT